LDLRSSKQRIWVNTLGCTSPVICLRRNRRSPRQQQQNHNSFCSPQIFPPPGSPTRAFLFPRSLVPLFPCSPAPSHPVSKKRPPQPGGLVSSCRALVQPAACSICSASISKFECTFCTSSRSSRTSSSRIIWLAVLPSSLV